MTRSTCTEAGCVRDAHGRGLCGVHYGVRYRSGTLPCRADRNLAEEFWTRVRITEACWLWLGPLNDYGYGRFEVYRRIRTGAHRFAWEGVNGQVPDGLVLDHLCRNRACVNPDHLEAVTQGENVRRGIGPSAINARRTHCQNGHEFTPDNTRIETNGTRRCRACIRARLRARAAAIRGEQ